MGEWLVIPKQNLIKTTETEVYLESKLMDVLLCLCSAKPEVVSADKLIETCWPNQFFSDNPVHKSIARLRNALNDDARRPTYIKTIPKKGYTIIQTVTSVESLDQAPDSYWQDGPPYLGFNSYQFKHQPIFFGRHKAAAEVKELINQCFIRNQSLIMVMGPHGVGKTSLIDTKTMPFLQTLTFPNKQSLGSSLKFTISTDKNIDESERLIKLILKNTQSSSLEKLYQSQTTHVLFFDQLEHIILNKSSDQINSFMTLFVQLHMSGNFFIITAFNHEYFADLMLLIDFRLLKKQALVYDLPPPDREEISEIIRGPVAASGLSFKYDPNTYQSLDHVLIEDAQTIRHILPTLSHVMRELCLNKNEHNELTLDAYKRMGNLSQFISKQFDDIFNNCDLSEQQAFKDRLHHLIKFDPTNSDKLYCAEIEISQFREPSINGILDKLMLANLIVTRIIDDKTYLTIVDDTLLNQCEVFVSWVAENRLKITALAEFRVLHTHWKKNNCLNAYLINNEYLLSSAQSLKLNHSEASFLNRSLRKNKTTKIIKRLTNSALVVMLIIVTSLLVKLQTNHNHLIVANKQAEAFSAFLMKDLKSKLKPIGKLDLLSMISKQIIQYYDTKIDTKLSISSINHLIDALNTLGEVQVQSGDLDDAMDNLLLSSSYAKHNLDRDNKHVDTLFHSSQNQYWIGYIYYLRKNWQATEKHWSEYHKLSNALTQIEPKNITWRLEQSYALNNLGTLSMSLGHNKKANTYFNQSAEIKQKLVDENPSNSQFIAELADTISWQASLMSKENQLIFANELYKHSLFLSKRLAKIDPSDSDWIYRKAVAYHRLGLSDYDLGNLSLAKINFTESLSLIKQNLDIDPINHKWLKSLINNHIGLARINRHLSLYDEALWHVDKGLFHYYQYTPQIQKLAPQLKQFLHLSTVSSFILHNLGQHKTALSQYLKAFNESDQYNKNIQSSSLEKAKHYFILSQLQKSVDDQASMNMLGLAQEALKDELNKGNEDKIFKALILKVNPKAMSKEMYLNFKKQLNEMHYKNPDFFITKRNKYENNK